MASNDTDALVQNILGQYYYALGQGAGGSMRVTRGAIEAFRTKHLPRIVNIAVDWNQYHIGILEYIRGVGRHAAWLATLKGSIAIGPEEINAAMKASEGLAHATRELQNVEFFGDGCPQDDGGV
jgi:hypothetical protein